MGLFFFHIKLVYSLDLPSPPRMPVANKGLGWDSGALKTFHVILVMTRNPHPGWGVDPMYVFSKVGISSIEPFGRSLNPLKFGMLTPKIATIWKEIPFPRPIILSIYLCFISRVCQCTPCFWELACVFTICMVFELMYPPIFVGNNLWKNDEVDDCGCLDVCLAPFRQSLAGRFWGLIGFGVRWRFGEKWIRSQQTWATKKGPKRLFRIFLGMEYYRVMWGLFYMPF